MPLDTRWMNKLVALVQSTRDDEIDCDACLSGMAEFVEAEIVGLEIPQALRRIEEHLGTCPECAEEYGVLRDLVRSVPPGSIE